MVKFLFHWHPQLILHSNRFIKWDEIFQLSTFDYSSHSTWLSVDGRTLVVVNDMLCLGATRAQMVRFRGASGGVGRRVEMNGNKPIPAFYAPFLCLCCCWWVVSGQSSLLLLIRSFQGLQLFFLILPARGSFLDDMNRLHFFYILLLSIHWPAIQIEFRPVNVRRKLSCTKGELDISKIIFTRRMHLSNLNFDFN